MRWYGAGNYHLIARDLSSRRAFRAYAEQIDVLTPMLNATPLALSRGQVSALPVIPVDERGPYMDAIELPFDPLYIDFGEQVESWSREDQLPPVGGLFFRDDRRGIVGVPFTHDHKTTVVMPALWRRVGDSPDGFGLAIRGGLDGNVWAEATGASVALMLAALYLVNSAFTDLVPAERNARSARMSEQGRQPALTVAIRGRRDWHIPVDEEGNLRPDIEWTHRWFRRGGYQHHWRASDPIVLPHKVRPCPEGPHWPEAQEGRRGRCRHFMCRRVWSRPTVCGHDYLPLAPKTHTVSGLQGMPFNEKATIPPAPNEPAKEKIPTKLRKAVLRRDGHQCQECGSTQNLHVDHIYPEALGGKATMENLQALCRSCNCRKGAKVAV